MRWASADSITDWSLRRRSYAERPRRQLGISPTLQRELMATAVVLTVGNEIVSGDVENTNASWLGRRLAALGVSVKLMAAIRDEVEEIAAFLRAEGPRTDFVFVTGGLGGTPDDLTREGVAEGFGVRARRSPMSRRGCGSASSPAGSATTPPGGRACQLARSRSKTRSAARRASSSRTSTSFPACRAR